MTIEDIIKHLTKLHEYCILARQKNSDNQEYLVIGTIKTLTQHVKFPGMFQPHERNEEKIFPVFFYIVEKPSKKSRDISFPVLYLKDIKGKMTGVILKTLLDEFRDKI